MPPRHNLFQDVVAIIERHKAAGASVTESAELIDRDTGETREVDVTVTTTVPGNEVVMSIEAADRSRRADLPWVEQQIAKDVALATDHLVLVAAAGFTEPALRKATAHGAVTITPKDMEDDEHDFAVISKLSTPPITIEPFLTGTVLDVYPPSLGIPLPLAPERVSTAEGADAELDGIANAIFEKHFEGFVARAASDLSAIGPRKFAVAEPPPEPLFAEASAHEDRPAVRLPVVGVQIEVSVDVQEHPEMQMVARLFDETLSLYGETKLGAAQAIFVATEQAGVTHATLRTREHQTSDPVDWTYDGVVELDGDGTQAASEVADHND